MNRKLNLFVLWFPARGSSGRSSITSRHSALPTQRASTSPWFLCSGWRLNYKLDRLVRAHSTEAAQKPPINQVFANALEASEIQTIVVWALSVTPD